jgi:hypothetical protein
MGIRHGPVITSNSACACPGRGRFQPTRHKRIPSAPFAPPTERKQQSISVPERTQSKSNEEGITPTISVGLPFSVTTGQPHSDLLRALFQNA